MISRRTSLGGYILTIATVYFLSLSIKTAHSDAPLSPPSSPLDISQYYNSLSSSFVAPPTKNYAAPTTQSPTYKAPSLPSTNYGGYQVPLPSPSPTYGYPPSPSPSPAPGPTYGYPPSDNSAGYDELRQISNSYDSAFVQRRLFNTSVALTVPLFSFTLPQRASQGSTVDLANQAIFGLFSLLVVVLVFAVPILFTGSRPGYTAAGSGLTGRSNTRTSKDNILNNLMSSNKVFNFMGADLTNNIGLDTEKCLQKTICEAHRSPKKYGLLATPFQIFFPPPSSASKAESGNGTTASSSSWSSLYKTSTSIYQLAAKDGKYSKKDCGGTYKCFFDFLDLADYFIDWWKYSTNPNYVLEM